MSEPEVRTVTLPSGAVLTLTIEIEWLLASDEDLAFVRDLARRMDRGIAPPDGSGAIDVGAPASCATCGVALGSWPAAVEHGRIGCKTFDTGEVPCPDCGRKFASLGGLGVHRARAHPKPASAPAAPIVSEHKCEGCGRMFNGAQGLGRHLPACERALNAQSQPEPRNSLTLVEDEEDDEDDWVPPAPPRAEPEPEHRLAETRRANGGHVAFCSCTWRTPYPVANRSDAVARLRDHVDEMAVAQ